MLSLQKYGHLVYEWAFHAHWGLGHGRVACLWTGGFSRPLPPPGGAPGSRAWPAMWSPRASESGCTRRRHVRARLNRCPFRDRLQVLPCDIDLLNPPKELEKRKHKLKRLVASPNSYFMDVKCQGCFNMYVLFLGGCSVRSVGNWLG